jgi:hypothetical protein
MPKSTTNKHDTCETFLLACLSAVIERRKTGLMSISWTIGPMNAQPDLQEQLSPPMRQ